MTRFSPVSQPPSRPPVRRHVVGPVAELSWGKRARLIHVLGLMFSLPACSIPGPQTDKAAMETLPRSEVQAAGVDSEAPVSISYLHGGDKDGQRLIFIHGTPGEAKGWADFVMDPPQGTEAIAIDRPGFGESGPKGAITSLQAQAAALEPLLEERDGRWPILVGHSLGGPIVARAAVDYPDRIAGLVIVAGSLDPDLEKIHPMQHVGAAWPIRPMLPRAIRNSNAELMALEPELRTLAARLDEIAVPVVIIHGTEDDLVPFENVAFMEAQFTGVEALDLIVLEGRNHFLPWNSKPDVDRAINMVIERTAGGAS